MQFLRRSHPPNLLRCRCYCHSVRTLYDAVYAIRCPRDRGLDHAVERETHLNPVLNLKNLIISEPSKSVPLTLINDSRENLRIPFRAVDFIRKYPSVFEEFYPGTLRIHPHIKLTPEIVSLNSEEHLLYQSVNYKEDIARRLLKLLMVCRVNQIPISVLERLKWELGLPQDYAKAIIPEFPDYFRVIGEKKLDGNRNVLELVCWSDEFAVSEMEKKGSNGGNVQFTLQYSTGFEMDKKYKKWVDEWQKLPYTSPYENAMHLETKSDEMDKWAVAVLHEVLSLFVGKKAEKESLLYLGEYLGLRSSFKRAFLQHPGIFYVSSKIRTYTVVLREAYRRGMLVERHPLIDMRYKYVQLMNVVKDGEKMKDVQQKSGSDVKEVGEELKVIHDGEADSVEMDDSSDDVESDDFEDPIHGGNANRRRGRFKRNDTFEDRNTGKVDSDGSETDDFEDRTHGGNVNRIPGRFKRNDAFEDRNTGRVAKSSNGRFKEKDEFKSSRENGRINEKGEFKSSTRFSRRTNTRDNKGFEDKDEFRSSTKFSGRTNTRDNERFKDKDEFKSSTRFSSRTNTQDSKRFRDKDEFRSSTRFSRRTNTRDDERFKDKDEFRSPTRFSRRTNTRDNERFKDKDEFKSSTKFSRRTNTRDGDQNVSLLSPPNLKFSRNKEQSV